VDGGCIRVTPNEVWVSFNNAGLAVEKRLPPQFCSAARATRQQCGRALCNARDANIKKHELANKQTRVNLKALWRNDTAAEGHGFTQVYSPIASLEGRSHLAVRGAELKNIGKTGNANPPQALQRYRSVASTQENPAPVCTSMAGNGVETACFAEPNIFQEINKQQWDTPPGVLGVLQPYCQAPPRF
jgi:hypothetical protein